MKQNFFDKCVQNQVIWGHTCWKRPIRLKFRLKWPEMAQFWSQSQTKTSRFRRASKKACDTSGTFFQIAKNSRDLEPKMRKKSDAKHDTFGRIGRNLIPISKFISQRKLSKRIRNAIKSSSAIDLSLLFQDVQHPYKSKPTWGNKLRKKGQKWRKDEFRSVFKNLLQKNNEELSDHYRNFDCKTTESFRSACPNIRHFGALHAERNDL